MGITLRAARINKGLSREQAGDAIGVSKHVIANWERGLSFPHITQIPKIEAAYGLSYDQLNFLPHNNALSDIEEES